MTTPSRIVFVSSSYVPSRRASSVQVMKMCAAFSRQGHHVTLLSKACKQRQESTVRDPFDFYGVAADFEIEELPRPPWPGGGAVYALALYLFLRRNRHRLSLAYCRDTIGCWLATRLRIPAILEVHEPAPGPLRRQLVRSVLRSPSLLHLVAISRALKDEYLHTFPDFPAMRVVIAADGADPLPQDPQAERSMPSPLESATSLRIGYVGQLYPGKGLEIIIPLATALPDHEFHVLGGQDERLRSVTASRLPQNLILHGFIPPGDLGAYYPRFDIVLMPYQPRVEVASGGSDVGRWMSPLKMFEYMAAGKAIVSSDLPVLREVLSDGRNALLVPPTDLDAWIRAIRRLAKDATFRALLGARARHDLEEFYTWALRATKVLAGPPTGSNAR